MQRTPYANGSSLQKANWPSRKNFWLNGAVAALALLLIGGSAVAWMQGQRTSSSNVESSAAYRPAVEYTPPPVPTKVAFLGDSYTTGVGASSPSKRWTTLVSREQNWLELNYGFGGTNFGTGGDLKGGRPYTERLTDLVLAGPDVVIISSAGNALHIDQRAGIRKTFTDLREKLPDTRIIALSPFRWDGDYPAEFEEFGAVIEREVEAVGGEYIEIGHPLGPHPEAITKDGIHPNDTGYSLLADAIESSLPE